MRVLTVIALSCAILAGLSAVLVAAPGGVGTVVIDAGHGGYDHGIRTQDVREKDVTLEISRMLQRLFERGETYAYLSRKIDNYFTIEERWAASTENKPDVFISIHVGTGADFTVYTAWPGPSSEGAPADPYRMDMRQRRYLSESSALSLAVASALAQEFVTEVRRKEFSLPVLDGVSAPAVLVEVPARGIDFDYDMGRVAGALYNGIIAYADTRK